MKLKIREILWEITNRCNRNCDFCGSKSIINCGDDTSAEEKTLIANAIAAVRPEKVTISGGEPLMVDYELLEQCVTSIQAAGTQVSLVTNGDALTNKHCGLFDLIGISVNSKKDAEAINKLLNLKLSQAYLEKIVWITNVNKINYFDIEDIIAFATMNNIPIQWQLTMYHNPQPEMIDGEAIADVREKIAKACQAYDINYIFADNLQEEHVCTAGTEGLGILFNGDVVPCLSERSWRVPRVQGNVIEMPLEQIWTEAFKACRFSDDFACCRDCFKYPKAKPKAIFKIEDLKGDEKEGPGKECPDIFPTRPDDSGMDRMMLYGVTYPRDTAPIPWRGPYEVKAYGVFDFYSNSSSSSE